MQGPGIASSLALPFQLELLAGVSLDPWIVVRCAQGPYLASVGATRITIYD